MTVSDLIELLKDLPQDIKVVRTVVLEDGWYHKDVEGIVVHDDSTVGID